MASVLFTNVAVFDGTGKTPERGEVRVEGRRIAAVARGGAALDRRGAAIVDGKGATLMPGLVEAHAHLSWPSSVDRVINAMTMAPEEHLLVTARNARVTLDHGFTSAYSAGSLGVRFEVALRDEIDGGWLPGPRLKASSIERAPGNIFGVPQAHGEGHGRGPDAMRAYIKSCAEMRLDSIKLLLSGDDNFTPNGSQELAYEEAEVEAAGAQARASGIWLACHAQAAAAVKLGVRYGFRVLYHCSYADDEALDMLEAKKSEIFVAPAAGLAQAAIEADPSFNLPAALVERGHRILALQMQLVPELRRRGIRVLPGGDYGFPHNPIGRNARDLELFVTKLGFTPEEALMSATKWGGEIMGMGDELGLIEPGYLADLLLVDGDPVKDISILQDRAKLLMIMKDGAYHKAPPEHRIMQA
ncbi:MAG TPA: amidohydrolase family protein [Stellaceae bacterium]|jgi:imidazolonepropionase-like amidohydrolase|nr:amidohydrolase family protein [Stellaceae bacterium]